MNAQEFAERSASLCHAIQTGVAYEHERGSKDGTPKHLRVGVNTALCETSAMAKLLISKGIITEEEYYDSVIEMMTLEVRRYEKRLSKATGVIVSLG